VGENRLVRRLAATLGLLLVSAGVFVTTAFGHVQVRPAEAAPGDPTLFTLLVPNEERTPTVRVDLKIPAGVVPVSFAETPGWTRTERRRADDSIDVVTWRGSLAPDDFVQFSFIATTPDRSGAITWPTVQVYRGGTTARWIGPPGSDEPAPVTQVSGDVPRENAGGEGGEAAAPATTSGSTGSGTSGSSDTLAVVAVAVAGLALAAAIAAIARGRRRLS
jgi:uncharacterized protein YcnI